MRKLKIANAFNDDLNQLNWMEVLESGYANMHYIKFQYMFID